MFLIACAPGRYCRRSPCEFPFHWAWSVFAKKVNGGKQQSGRAKPALQPMAFRKRPLDRMPVHHSWKRPSTVMISLPSTIGGETPYRIFVVRAIQQHGGRAPQYVVVAGRYCVPVRFEMLAQQFQREASAVRRAPPVGSPVDAKTRTRTFLASGHIRAPPQLVSPTRPAAPRFRWPRLTRAAIQKRVCNPRSLALSS